MSNLFSIEGKTAVVTGGSRGIGLMIARGMIEKIREHIDELVGTS